MRYRKEYKTFIVTIAVILAVLLVVAYTPTFWTSGDNTPLEHSLDSPPPPEFRVP